MVEPASAAEAGQAKAAQALGMFLETRHVAHLLRLGHRHLALDGIHLHRVLGHGAPRRNLLLPDLQASNTCAFTAIGCLADVGRATSISASTRSHARTRDAGRLDSTGWHAIMDTTTMYSTDCPCRCWLMSAAKWHYEMPSRAHRKQRVAVQARPQLVGRRRRVLCIERRQLRKRFRLQTVANGKLSVYPDNHVA